MPRPGASYSSSAGSAGGGAGGVASAGAGISGGALAFGAMTAFQIGVGLHNAEIIRANYKIQKQINELNAQFADLDAYNAEVDGYSEVSRYQGIINDTVDQVKFVYDINNVDSDFGTARTVVEETKQTGFLNTLDIQNQARAKALGYKREARNMRLGTFMQGLESNQEAKSAVTSAVLGAGRTALSGYEYSKGK